MVVVVAVVVVVVVSGDELLSHPKSEALKATTMQIRVTNRCVICRIAPLFQHQVNGQIATLPFRLVGCRGGAHSWTLKFQLVAGSVFH
jgi:hypothetical protein